MTRTETLEWHSFMSGNVVAKEARKSTVVKTAAIVHTALIPKAVYAAASTTDTWTEVFLTVLNCVDWLCAGIIVYAGVTWMFGNRTKALEFLMGGSIGYIIVRHALDIRNWLKTL